ncbi:MAG: SMP-30/gluconolactonase/LRE family protein [Gammaproteobacteria bacterium]
MKVIKILLVIVVVLVVGVTVGLWSYLKFAGDESHFAGTCEALELGESAEDMQIDRERGFAYLSLIDRMSLAKGESAQGWIGRLDLNATERSVEPALIDPPPHFRPHGVSLLVDAAGQRHLFVINHPENRGSEPESVESFREEQPGRFRHVRTYTDTLFTSPNDIVAVGPAQFYIANDSNRGTTQLVYVDGDEIRAVADDIASGGGINVSLDGGTLYIAETSGKRIRSMRREPATGDVETIEMLDIGTSPDNIDVAADGSLWVGAHSNIIALVMHFIAGADAPTQILQMLPGADGGADVTEIYLNRGEQISAGSVGVTYGDELLIGSITARKILICEMDGA